MRIHRSEFIHPEDAAARRQLEAIPGFAQVVKLGLRIGLEQFHHGINMATKIRLSPGQLPDLYKRLPPICEKLGIDEPEFYLEMNPMPNAYTFGDTRVYVTITSGLIEYLDDDELDTVIAHECGHIACRHVLYHTLGHILVSGAANLGLAGNLILPLQLGLFYWSRRSEFSADRAACAVMGAPEPVVETMIRLAGGPKSITDKVNVDVFAQQAKEYELLKEKTWDRILQTLAVMHNQHPYHAVRVREIRRWADSDQFRNIMEETKKQNGDKCPGCFSMAASDWKFCKKCGQKLK
jgi:Zn-dependent protease with chaperone function